MLDSHDPTQNSPETDNQTTPAEPAEPADGTYHIVRPDREREETAGQKTYSDAAYHPQAEATVPPQYYTPQEKPHAPETPHSGRKTFWRIACLCLVCAILGGIVGAALIGRGPAAPEQPAPPPASSGPLAAGPAAAAPVSASEVYAAACQQVVGITTEITYRNIFGQTTSQPVSGTGFFITEDGYILTNFHVIAAAYQDGYDVNVMTFDGTSYKAEVIGAEPDNDVAVLRIDASGVSPVTFGDSGSIAVGETVYAVGNPLGELHFTMTTGHVSALDRTIVTGEGTAPINMFQFDAAVNGGNSGGPVYNAAGQVIGIVTAKYESTGVEGLGFAIPINDAVHIANDLMENGYVTGKAQLGIIPQTVPPQVAQYYNLVEGALVYSITEGSCAEKAGLRTGDIITKLGDAEVTSIETLKAALRGFSGGDETTVSVYRSGETLELPITLDEAGAPIRPEP